MTLRPGVYLQDRYEVLEQIGSGGMSVVYKAKCHKLNRLVAIKVLKEEFCNDSNFVGKFKMEAQAAAGLSHPNIVSVYDVIDEGKIHYIVMELIEGITLKSYINKKGKLEVKESIGIAIQVGQGIAAAHEQHIIHRDIKPQNMIISRDGKVKVADFGIARAVSAQTLSSAAMGSVHYISPEQARGGYSDARSDIYSLGITMYEMVTGHLPFEGDNTVSIALAHLEDAMVPPSVYNPEVSRSVEQIILKCTEKKPERRYANVNDVIADLRTALLYPETNLEHEAEVASSNALSGETIPISDEELAQIKGRKRPMAIPAEPAGNKREYVQEAAATRKPEQNPENNVKPVKKPSKNSSNDEVNPQIERLLTGAGIAVAIIIVAVVITVFFKVTDLFQFGFGSSQPTDEVTVESTVSTAEATLKDTEVYMPEVKDLPEDMAEAKLKDSFLNMKRTYEYFDDIEKGHVASQEPVAGTVVSKYSNVAVVISNGSDKINLTELELEKLDLAAAKTLLESKKLKVEVVEEENETVSKGSILRFTPELLPEGETVTLYISSGPKIKTVTVPNLTGKTETEGIALLAEAGLSPGTTETAYNDTVPKGSIISQSGGNNGVIEVGGKINYVVSSGQEVKHQRYVASINDTYDLSNLIGPGAGSTSVTILIRLHQVTNGESVTKVLTEARTISGSVLLPISYTSIESLNGTDEGEVQVIDAATGAVLRSYPLTFFPMD